MASNESEIIKLQENFTSAIKTKDSETVLEIGNELIEYYKKKNDVSSCLTYGKALTPYMLKAGKENVLGKNLNFIGACYSIISELDEAEDYYLQALKIYEKNDIKLGIAEVECNLGILFRHRGIFNISLSHLITGINIYNEIKSEMDSSPNNNPWNNYINAVEACGIIYGQLKRYDESVKFLQDALILKEKHLGNSGKISALMNLGVTYSNFDVDKAMDYYLQALNATNEETHLVHRVVLLSNLGGCLEDKDNLTDALKYYHEALELLKIVGKSPYKAPILKNIATAYYKQGSYEKSLEYIEESLDLSQKLGAKQEIQDCYLTLSDIFTAKNEFNTALEYRIKYDTIRDELFQQDLTSQLTDLQKKYEKTTLNIKSLKEEKSLISEELTKVMKTGFIGRSSCIKEVKRLASEAALYKDARVLITGESGVGKEIIARFIHYSDAMNNGRFIDVNCCSIPESMAESEFFGFVNGAFTGAINSKSGYFEEAHHGTLFLDEIGDMPVSLQAKLLRVLETQEVKRLGSNKSNAITFRLISATNKDINDLIQTNLFRADLMYRINTVEIHIPPLRDRQEDIEPLLDYFLTEFARKMNKAIPKYKSAVLNSLKNYAFPGNVRELKNMVEKAMIFMKGYELSVEDFSSQMRSSGESGSMVERKTCVKLNDLEDQILLQTLEECGGNQTMAAQKIGISYSTFKRKYKKLKGN